MRAISHRRFPPDGRSPSNEIFPRDVTLISPNTREMVAGSRVTLFGERRSERRRPCSIVALLRNFTDLGSTSAFAAVALLGGCAPQVSAGEWQCPGDGGVLSATDPVAVPWSTGFEAPRGLAHPEEAFCDYGRAGGYCYGDEPYALVAEPHHLGRFAAEFKVVGGKVNQTRCVRQGVLPASAYYGAWYFIPEALKATDSAWNLWHFKGAADESDSLRDLWDVTLVKGAQAGDWELVVYDRLANNSTYRGKDRRRVPIGSWFHIELFLKRAADATGEIRLYQDGELLFEQTDLKSDTSKFSQWYVGNWAPDATPANSSVFVDDVSISATLSSNGATP